MHTNKETEKPKAASHNFVVILASLVLSYAFYKLPSLVAEKAFYLKTTRNRWGENEWFQMILQKMYLIS